MIFLTISFFITAILYAAVGFGGGSTYNALLVVAAIDYKILPVIALICNLIVVSGGSCRFFCAGHVHFKKILPWVVTSVPAAWLGGFLPISEVLFVGILGFCLLFSSVHMLFVQNNRTKQKLSQFVDDDYSDFLVPMGIGSLLGFLAGMVGIGGGIFLAPILYFLRWGNEKAIAATCSIFIMVNSLSGLTGHIMKMQMPEFFNTLQSYWPLFIVVLIGGQIGSYTGAVRLNPKTIRLMTGVLIFYVSVRLIWRWWGMVY
ncbi:MAG: sulfite exporter TauE/SafE family protein [Alphaproteobacteria bacterium]